MPKKRPTRRATIAGIAAHQPHAYRAKYSPLCTVLGFTAKLIRAVVGVWAFYWFVVILIHLASTK